MVLVALCGAGWWLSRPDTPDGPARVPIEYSLEELRAAGVQIDDLGNGGWAAATTEADGCSDFDLGLVHLVIPGATKPAPIPDTVEDPRCVYRDPVYGDTVTLVSMSIGDLQKDLAPALDARRRAAHAAGAAVTALDGLGDGAWATAAPNRHGKMRTRIEWRDPAVVWSLRLTRGAREGADGEVEDLAVAARYLKQRLDYANGYAD